MTLLTMDNINGERLNVKFLLGKWEVGRLILGSYLTNEVIMIENLCVDREVQRNFFLFLLLITENLHTAVLSVHDDQLLVDKPVMHYDPHCHDDEANESSEPKPNDDMWMTTLKPYQFPVMPASSHMMLKPKLSSSKRLLRHIKPPAVTYIPNVPHPRKGSDDATIDSELFRHLAKEDAPCCLRPRSNPKQDCVLMRKQIYNEANCLYFLVFVSNIYFI